MKLRKKLLSVTALAFAIALGAGVFSLKAQAEGEQELADFEVTATSIRTADPAGLRFQTVVGANAATTYANAEAYTTLTLTMGDTTYTTTSTVNAWTVDGKGWNTVLLGIPEVNYITEVTAQSFIKVDETTTYATQAVTSSIAKTASLLMNAGERAETVTKYTANAVTAIEMAQTAEVYVGTTIKLAATTTPAGYGVVWSSSDTSVATVAKDGTVTGVKAGTATIKATMSGVEAACTVTVANNVSATCVDVNNDGVCDDCEESVLVTLDVFAVNDLHGKFSDSDTQIGVDELTTYLKKARLENANTVVLSSGDMWQGTSESNLTYGNIITEWMNELDFVSMTMGNHEYDWGKDAILSNAELAQFPFLALNIFYTQTNERVEYVQPSVMVEQGGLKIGVIGAIGDCYSSISADKVQDVYFKTGDDLTALVKAESQALKAQGADCIIYSIHDGYSGVPATGSTLSDLTYYDEVLSGDYVDVVFESHTHQAYVFKDGYGTYHLQGGGDNKGITHAELTVNFARNEAETKIAEFIATSTYANLADDPIVNELLSKYDEQISKAARVLGQNDQLRKSTEVLETVAKLYYEAGVERWGDEYEIVLGGGYLSARSPYQIAAGEVIYGDVQSVLPFDNPVVLCSIPGSALDTQFVNTTNGNYYIYYGEYGTSVKDNIDPNKTYYIITDTYSSLYEPNKATEIARYDDQIYARDLLAKFIENGGWTTVPDPTPEPDPEPNPEPAPEDDGPIALTSIPQIHAIGSALEVNGETTEEYYVKGVIQDVPNATWGNLTLVDENGNTLYIYGLYDTAGNRYDAFTVDKPQKGDAIIVKSRIKNYVNNNGQTIELVNATFIKETYAFTDYETIYTLGNALTAGGKTAEEYYVTGTIVSIANENSGIMTIQAENGTTLYIYRTYDENGVAYGSMSEKPVVGQSVIVKGVIMKYVNNGTGAVTIELYDAKFLPFDV